MFSTSGGYHEYIEGCSVHRGDIMSTSGDVQSIGDIMMHMEDIVSTSRDVEQIGVFNINQRLLRTCFPH